MEGGFTWFPLGLKAGDGEDGGERASKASTPGDSVESPSWVPGEGEEDAVLGATGCQPALVWAPVGDTSSCHPG